MAELNSLSHEKSFVDAMIALEKQIRDSEDASLVVDYFSKTLKDIQSTPVISQQTKDARQLDGSATAPKESVAAPFPDSAESSNSHSKVPKYTPVLNQRLPTDLQDLIGEYQCASVFVLRELIEHGGVKQHRDSQGHISLVQFMVGQSNLRSMRVDLDLIKNHDGYYLAVPRIGTGHYRLLLNSMLRRQSKLTGCQRKEKLREMAAKLDLTIAGRSAVHEWYKCLPEEDSRVDDNANHAAFLATLTELRDRMNLHL